MKVDDVLSVVTDGGVEVVLSVVDETGVVVSDVVGRGVEVGWPSVLVVVAGTVVDAVTEETIHEHAELTALGFESQFSRYVGIEVGSVLIVVVYVAQNSRAKELKRLSSSSRRQLSG